MRLTFLLSNLMLLSSMSNFASANAETVQVVPSGTKIVIVLESALNSRSATAGQELKAHPKRDVVIDGTISIPRASTIVATLSKVQHVNNSLVCCYGFWKGSLAQ